MKSYSLRTRIQRDIGRLLQREIRRSLTSNPHRRSALVRQLTARAGSQVEADLQAFAVRDAAAHSDMEYIYGSYRSFRAVLAYRAAHLLYQLRGPSNAAAAEADAMGELAAAARRIAEEAKVETGVEIHPGAVIGPRFVIDHGIGTVIGEQAVIGSDCYFLQHVTIGGRSIGDSSRVGGERRHPRIGDRVQIGGNAMVLGPVQVGDDCVIEAGARVTCDVPANSRVRVISTLQVTVAGQCPEIHGLALIHDELLICGLRLGGILPAILDDQRNPIVLLPISSRSDTYIRCAIPPSVTSSKLAIGFFVEGSMIGYVTPGYMIGTQRIANAHAAPAR